jgi:hypothetical protein
MLQKTAYVVMNNFIFHANAEISSVENYKAFFLYLIANLLLTSLWLFPMVHR